MKNAMNIKEVQKFLERGDRIECFVSFEGFPNCPSITSKVTVQVTDYIDSYNVHINWEDEPFCLENYRDFNLYGYYSTKFCGMAYDDGSNSLIITDSNYNKIILSY